MGQFTFDTWQDPYDACFATCSSKRVTLESGLTVLVGCNGSGKSTMIHNIKEVLKKDNIPYYSYDNLSDGGHNSLSTCMGTGNYGLSSLMMCSSEGENININLASVAKNMKEFIQTGETPKSKQAKKWASFFADTESSDFTDNRRFVLMDAVDSGFSVDNIVMLKSLFNHIVQDSIESGKETYIIISANEYELANGESCLDVTTGKCITFSSYDDYRQFILKSRKKKDNRDEKAIVKQDARAKKRDEMLNKIVDDAFQKNKLESKSELEWREEQRLVDCIKAKCNSKRISISPYSIRELIEKKLEGFKNLS